MRTSPGVTSALLVLCGVIVQACGGADGEAEYPSLSDPLPASDEKAHTAPAARRPAPEGVLYREDVARVVDAGLGQFLQQVDLEPSLEQGIFRGFRIVDLRPPGFWRGVDLEPGDIVTSVNGMPIEKPPEAFQAFQSVKKADRLVVHLLRGGKPRQLVFQIRERSAKRR